MYICISYPARPYCHSRLHNLFFFSCQATPVTYPLPNINIALFESFHSRKAISLFSCFYLLSFSLIQNNSALFICAKKPFKEYLCMFKHVHMCICIYVYVIQLFRNKYIYLDIYIYRCVCTIYIYIYMLNAQIPTHCIRHILDIVLMSLLLLQLLLLLFLVHLTICIVVVIVCIFTEPQAVIPTFKL